MQTAKLQPESVWYTPSDTHTSTHSLPQHQNPPSSPPETQDFTKTVSFQSACGIKIMIATKTVVCTTSWNPQTSLKNKSEAQGWITPLCIYCSVPLLALSCSLGSFSSALTVSASMSPLLLLVYMVCIRVWPVREGWSGLWVWRWIPW